MFIVDRIATYKHMNAEHVTGFCALIGYNRLNAAKSCSITKSYAPKSFSLYYKITVE